MKNVWFSLLFLLSFGNSILIAQPNIEWQKKYGGTASETAYYIIQTSDGGYIAIGGSTSNNGDVSGHHGNTNTMDFWVVKMRPDGAIQWENCFGGSNTDFGRKIRQTSDGGYVFVGTVTSFDGDVSNFIGNYDYWVVKLDEDGNIQWEKTFGTPGLEVGDDIVQTEDGGYFVVGSDTYSDFWLLKIDSLGTLLWSETYGGSSQESAPTMAATNDKGCVMAGWSWSTNGDVSGHHGTSDYGDYWVVKVDSLGSIQWEISLGGNFHEQTESIIYTAQGEYLVTGFSFSNDGDVTGHHGLVGNSKDGWLVKLSSQGEIQWQKSLGGTQYDEIISVSQTSDGGFIAAGSTNSTDGDVSGDYHGDGDCWMVKFSNDGAIEWQELIGGSQSEQILACIQTGDGGYAFTGTTSSTDGDVIPTGNSSSDYWIVKLSPEMLGTEDVYSTSKAVRLEIHPNPTTTFISLSIPSEAYNLAVCISNNLGQQLLHQTIPNGSTLDISSLPNGIYSVLATTPSDKVYSNKFTKQE